MKVKFIVFIILSISFLNCFSQESKKNSELLPFTSIASSSYLTAKNQLSIAEVYLVIREKYVDPLIDLWQKRSDLRGEFWEYDNLLINIISFKSSDVNPSRLNLSHHMYGIRPGGAYSKETDTDYTKIYFDEIKKVNNYEVFVGYFKHSIKKDFVIISQDKQYYLMGSITCREKEVRKAKAFLETLLQSIKFK